MKRIPTYILLVSGVLVLFMTQCVFEEIPEPVVPDNVSFSEDIMPIFNANCNSSSCHDLGGIAPDLSPQNAWSALQDGYINTTDPTASLLVTSMDGGSMAPYSSAQDIATIVQWIKDGAPNN